MPDTPHDGPAVKAQSDNPIDVADLDFFRPSSCKREGVRFVWARSPAMLTYLPATIALWLALDLFFVLWLGSRLTPPRTSSAQHRLAERAAGGRG